MRPTPLPPPPPGARAHPARRDGHATVLTLAVAAAVALAFADSSIVVLALPDLYGEFDTSIVAVSWVVTAYNLAIAATALVLVPIEARLRSPVLAAVGFGVFAAASVGCAVAGSFGVLVGARVVQGVGGALLMVASLPVLIGLTDHEPRARAMWGLAGTVGAAVGPALGGLLTQVLTWRSIFWVQAPVALVALVATTRPEARRSAHDVTGTVGWRQHVANLGFLLLFAALVGALFLAVLMVVVVWGYPPLLGAVAVSALPVGALLARPLEQAAPPWLVAVSGGALLGGGLLALALLPGASAGWAAPALGACGLGLGLTGGVLGHAALPPGSALQRSATLTVGARHVGFVLGLVVIAPMLSADITAATLDATRASAAVILDADVPLTQKVPLVLDLRDEIAATPKGRVPDLERPFTERGADDDQALARLGDDLTAAIENTITRAFRPSYALAGLFGVLAAGPALVVALRPLRRDAP